ncbi:MAG: outer membrane protein assembly factor BamA [Rickettsiaceae bacterium]|nr:outer membrane protein assembly factor BamA [Rickettsiaceae bacterium]
MNKLSKIILATSILYSQVSLAESVKQIHVEGNHRMERSSIINYLSLKNGQEYTKEKEQESIKRLYDTNLFDDIKIFYSSGLVKVFVKETPLVTKVLINGNSRIKSGTIAKEILTHKGSSVNKANIKSDIDKIRELYRKSGRYAVTVTAKVENLDSGRAHVIFQIKEGPKTSIKYINFVGNKNYRDSELRSIIMSKQKAWFRFMDTSDTYDLDRFEYDKYLMKRFYNSLGYADFRVVSTLSEISRDKDYFTLTYTVEEGRKYNFGKITMENTVEGLEPEDLQKMIFVKEGQVYNATQLEKVSETINAKLADMGYAGAVVEPEEIKDQANNLVNIKFVITKASKFYIDKININGNIKTRDNVVRRQIKINEGDLFNRSTITKGEQNLRNLDYFETVGVEVAPSKKGKNNLDVNVNLEEKSTASVQFEVGYDSMQGIVGKVNFLERNLLGTGRYLSAGIEKYEKKTQEHIGLTDPYFLDRDLLAGINLFHTDSHASSRNPFNLKTNAGSLRIGYEVATDLRHDITYTLKNDKLSGPSDLQKSIHIFEQYGSTTTSSIANSLTYDQTDSSVIPKNGYVLSATETVAGLGGDAKYLKHEADFKIFKSFWENNYTFKIFGEAGKIHGYGGKKIGINERFNLGDYTLRGFEMSGVGPRDKRTKESLGGQNYYKLTTELEFPVGFPKEFGVTGAVFCDVGALWGFDIKSPNLYSKSDVYNSTAPRVSVGAGIIWMTRFAPIRIDYAVPVKREKCDETQRWHFRFSTSF